MHQCTHCYEHTDHLHTAMHVDVLLSCYCIGIFTCWLAVSSSPPFPITRYVDRLPNRVMILSRQAFFPVLPQIEGIDEKYGIILSDSYHFNRMETTQTKYMYHAWNKSAVALVLVGIRLAMLLALPLSYKILLLANIDVSGECKYIM